MLPLFASRAVTLQAIDADWLMGVQVAVLRLDQIDPELSGNKWFKLRRHIEVAMEAGQHGFISVGGPHSNHLHALAAAGRRMGFATVGLVRGHEQTTPTIDDLRRFGMRLHWLGYGGYRQRHRAEFWSPWRDLYPNHHVIPEGGGGLDGALGCKVLVETVQALLPTLGWTDFDAWWMAAGTGTTLAGVVIGESARQPRMVYGALAGPGAHEVAQGVERLLRQSQTSAPRYQLLDASRRGFGRFDADLARFLFDTERSADIPLEPVYTAKALLALRDFMAAGRLAPGTRLIFVHTGGMQGRRACDEQLQQLLTLPS